MEGPLGNSVNGMCHAFVVRFCFACMVSHYAFRPFRQFPHAWHGKTGKAPPTPPGGLYVHAVHMLQ